MHHTPGNSLEMLFYHIEQCQEIQRIRKVPHLDDQIIATAVRILVTSNMFPLKEFNAWELTANKTYSALTTFFHEVYGQCLMALELRSTSGQNGYTSKTMYNVLEGDDNTDDNTVSTITQTAVVAAAGTTATSAGMSGITTTVYGLTINADIAAAINQLSANRATIMTQMVALSFAQEPTQHTRQFVARDVFQVPPIQQLAIPMQQAPFHAGAFHEGHEGHQGRHNLGRGHGGWGRTPFADYMRNLGAVPATPSHIVPYGKGNTQLPLGQGQNPNFSNIYKWYNNWNICFLSGFDLEDRHMSLMCLFRKMNHQSAFT
jgi:hypothetical protein